jgi:hypothetical protein
VKYEGPELYIIGAILMWIIVVIIAACLWVFRDGLDSRLSYVVFIALSGICVVGVVFSVGLTLRAF